MHKNSFYVENEQENSEQGYWQISKWCDQKDASGAKGELIPGEFADPECPVCKRIIQEVNEIFEQDDAPCSDPTEYCMARLLEAVHTSLVWRLSKQ
jgi:hypothetical protein